MQNATVVRHVKNTIAKNAYTCERKNIFLNGTVCAFIYGKKERERGKKMKNMIVLNTVAELIELLNKGSLDTLVNRVAFASDLLEKVRESGYNQICIDEEIGFMDDGGWIEIDEMGYVVDEAYLP